MRFSILPRSLFARLMVALVAVLAVTLLLIVLLIGRDRRDLAFWGSGASSSASTIVDTSRHLARLEQDQRAAAVERYRTRPLLTAGQPPARMLPLRRRIDAAIERAFAERIHEQLGSGYSVAIRPAQTQPRTVIRVMNESPSPAAGYGPPGARWFDVSVGLPDGEQVVFRTVAPRPGPPLPQRIFLQLGVLTLALTLVLYFMTRSITRPLSDLARAAEAIGRDSKHPPLEERGAKELRETTRAFNTMQDRLRRYLDSRTRVLAAMSHDLRTPLMRLRLRTELIEDAELRERFAADLDGMGEMVQGALSLFRGLNDNEAIGLVDVDALLAGLQAEFVEIGASVLVEGRSNGPLAARPRLLKRCLTNLICNAVDYGVRAFVHVCDDGDLVIRVRDEGPGIPADALERVFEPFYRIESSRNRETGGTGLGLSIARDIAQTHGGSVTLRNLPVRGLEAVLTLPRSHAAEG